MASTSIRTTLPALLIAAARHAETCSAKAAEPNPTNRDRLLARAAMDVHAALTEITAENAETEANH